MHFSGDKNHALAYRNARTRGPSSEPRFGRWATLPVLGYVAAKNANPKRLEVFKQGLVDLGYVEGRNIRIEYREAVLYA